MRYRYSRRWWARAARVMLLAILFSAAGAGSTRAQQPTGDAPSQPAPTVDSIEALRKQAAEAADLAAETKAKIDAACVQALDGLKRIAELGRLAEEFKRDADGVQQRERNLRRQLETLQRTEPASPDELSLPELEQEVSRRDVALAEHKAAQAKAETARTHRPNRRREIRTLLLSAKQRMADIEKQLETPAPAEEPPLLTQARRAALAVRRRVIEAETPALQNELAKYDAEDAAGILPLELDVVRQEIRLAGAELESLQKSLNQQRAADSAAAVGRARQALAAAPPPLKSLAEENVELSEAALQMSAPIEEARRNLERTKQRLEEVQKQFAAIQQRVGDIGLTGSIGTLLRRQRVGLPDVARRRRKVEERKTLIEETQYTLFEYDDLRSESIDAALERVLSGVSSNPGVADDPLADSARSLVEQRREALDGVIRNHNAYLDTLFELDATEQRLIRETGRYKKYIDERVLWIRSNRPLFSSFSIDDRDTWAFNPARWKEVVNQLGSDIPANPGIYAMGLAALLLLVWQKRKYRLELESIGQLAKRGTCVEFKPTARAAFLTLMLAVAWPGIVALLAWRLYASSNGSEFARAMSQALIAVSWVYFPLELLRQLCRRSGLGDAHFDWPPSTLRVFRRNLRWATPLGLLVVFLTSFLFYSDAEHGVDAVERVYFIVGMAILAFFLKRVLRPETGIFREYLQAHRGGWFDRLKALWYWGCVLVPLTLAGMTALGYYYTARQLIWRFYASYVFIVAVQILWAFLQRLLLVHRRSISIQQARERRAAEAANRQQSGETPAAGPEQIVPVEELQPDVAANTRQSQRLIRTGLFAASLVGMWMIWVDVLPALWILDRMPVWTTTVTTTSETAAAGGAVPLPVPAPEAKAAVSATAHAVEVLRIVTVADVALALLIGIVTLVCARNVPGLMEISLLQRLPIDSSVRYAVTSLTSYAIILIGVILAFNTISVGWSKVQWLATALTFGLAFGLQEMFANFVAGLILLFERPIRVGDVVTVDDVSGVVSRIRIRATTITNWDRKEYVIPNKEFITGRMLNWTLSDKTNRIVINVGVAYGSDVDRAKELLMSTCQGHPLILADPPTRVVFEGFGDNSLNLVVRTFLPDLDNRLAVIDQLHTDIDKAFRQAKIEIAFPQRDLHLRTVDRAALSAVISDEGERAA